MVFTHIFLSGPGAMYRFQRQCSATSWRTKAGVRAIRLPTLCRPGHDHPPGLAAHATVINYQCVQWSRVPHDARTQPAQPEHHTHRNTVVFRDKTFVDGLTAGTRRPGSRPWLRPALGKSLRFRTAELKNSRSLSTSVRQRAVHAGVLQIASMRRRSSAQCRWFGLRQQ
jgi:hypothetical protein